MSSVGGWLATPGSFSSSVGGLQRGGSASVLGSGMSTPRPMMEAYSAPTNGFGGGSPGAIRGTRATDLISGMPSSFNPGAGGPSGPAGSSLITLKPYLVAMGSSTELNEQEEISNFVPVEPSLFQTRMRDADLAFRSGRYEDAEGDYQLALALSRHSPEVHLGLVQTYVALGRLNTAGFHLQKALGYYPELPLTRMPLRKFYGHQEDFAQHIESLRREAYEMGGDGKIWLLLSFFYYFDGSDTQAIAALKRADKMAAEQKDADTVDAADTFWNGIVAAGRGAGPIENATLPATTQPARGSSGITEVKFNPLLKIEPSAASQP